MTTLDARGLACPLPLTLARRRMDELLAGDTLIVLATDSEAPIDLAAWAQDEGHGFRDLTGTDDVAGAAPGTAGASAAGAAPGAVGAPGAEAGWLTLELRKRP